MAQKLEILVIRRCSMLRRVPVKKLSTQKTCCPLASNCSQRWEPRNPAPPETKNPLLKMHVAYRSPSSSSRARMAS